MRHFLLLFLLFGMPSQSITANRPWSPFESSFEVDVKKVIEDVDAAQAFLAKKEHEATKRLTSSDADDSRDSDYGSVSPPLISHKQYLPPQVFRNLIYNIHQGRRTIDQVAQENNLKIQTLENALEKRFGQKILSSGDRRTAIARDLDQINTGMSGINEVATKYHVPRRVIIEKLKQKFGEREQTLLEAPRSATIPSEDLDAIHFNRSTINQVANKYHVDHTEVVKALKKRFNPPRR